MLGMLLQLRSPQGLLPLQQQFPLPSALNQSKTGLDNGEKHKILDIELPPKNKDSVIPVF